jgi:hypothetical protein
MIRFASSTIFNTAFFAELGENLGNLAIIWPMPCTPALLTETDDRFFHRHTQPQQFALRGWLGRSHNPAF